MSYHVKTILCHEIITLDISWQLYIPCIQTNYLYAKVAENCCGILFPVHAPGPSAMAHWYAQAKDTESFFLDSLEHITRSCRFPWLVSDVTCPFSIRRFSSNDIYTRKCHKTYMQLSTHTKKTVVRQDITVKVRLLRYAISGKLCV